MVRTFFSASVLGGVWGPVSGASRNLGIGGFSCRNQASITCSSSWPRSAYCTVLPPHVISPFVVHFTNLTLKP
ncbi:hypothetical protein BJV74DRAFT_808326 [Russula compacta]|nr:hypothetical protein BJV74DRAFT_808326 [Russula compacta]